MSDMTVIEPNIPSLELRERIRALERKMMTLPQVEIKTEHFFAPGVYVRQITIPKDTLLTGEIYREEHVHTVLRGDVSVVTERGLQRVQGPCTFVSPANVKRAGYAHEETVWQAAFANPDDGRDPDKIMERATMKTFYDEEAP